MKGAIKEGAEVWISTISTAVKTISIVIPALNEEGVVGNTVEGIPLHELKKLGLDAEMIVVDSSSRVC